MFSGGLSDLDRQRKYLYDIHVHGAPCPVCGKIQTPWAANGSDAMEWLTVQGERAYACVECHAKIRLDVYLMGGWGWGNPAVVAHR